MITTRRYAQSSTAASTLSPLFHPAPLPPPHQLPSSAAAGHRSFHASRVWFFHDDSTQTQTHYETLNVPYDASVSDIKRSFYKLSKVHHPDHNQKDPHASRRFMRISEAYAVLGQADKRALYDRDVMRRHIRSGHAQNQRQAQAAAAAHRPNASYHSTGPAGGRPASGLSRRRTTFKGPPPSFFKNGGGGSAQGYSRPGSFGEAHTSSSSSSSSHSAASGPHPGSAHPYEARANPSTPHFDKASNERTHRRMDERLAARRARASGTDAEGLSEPSMLVGFIVVFTAMAAGMLVPAMFFGGGWTKSEGKKKTQNNG